MPNAGRDKAVLVVADDTVQVRIKHAIFVDRKAADRRVLNVPQLDHQKLPDIRAYLHMRISGPHLSNGDIPALLVLWD